MGSINKEPIGIAQSDSTLNLKPRNRIAGLDTLRAVAILFVFMYHYMVFVSEKATFGWASTLGWTGVDLFFVLSGYLISNQIFSAMAEGRPFSLLKFYCRRLLRTLPNYYAILALYILIPYQIGTGSMPPIWKFLSFTQNFHLVPGTDFSHAWSLCIEEQFYLVLPIAAILALRYLPKRHMWTILGIATALGVAIRSILWLRYGLEAGGVSKNYYLHIYYSTLCRADEFLPGVAIAMIKNFHPKVWNRLMKQGRILTFAAIMSIVFLYYGFLNYYKVEDYGYGYFMTGFGYSLMALAFGILLLAALSPDSPIHRFRIPGAKFLALWSYGIYLSHKPIAYAAKLKLSNMGIDPSSWAAVGVVSVACLLGGWILFVVIETPFMRLRAKWFPQA